MHNSRNLMESSNQIYHSSEKGMDSIHSKIITPLSPFCLPGQSIPTWKYAQVSCVP
jgi:hypothetical protein